MHTVTLESKLKPDSESESLIRSRHAVTTPGRLGYSESYGRVDREPGPVQGDISLAAVIAAPVSGPVSVRCSESKSWSWSKPARHCNLNIGNHVL